MNLSISHFEKLVATSGFAFLTHETILPWNEHNDFYYCTGGLISIPEAIARVGVSGDEILVFDIDVEPVTGGGRRSVQFKREFFDD